MVSYKVRSRRRSATGQSTSGTGETPRLQDGTPPLEPSAPRLPVLFSSCSGGFVHEQRVTRQETAVGSVNVDVHSIPILSRLTSASWCAAYFLHSSLTIGCAPLHFPLPASLPVFPLPRYLSLCLSISFSPAPPIVPASMMADSLYCHMTLQHSLCMHDA